MKNAISLLAIICCMCACKKDHGPKADPLALLTQSSWKPSLTDKNKGTSPAGNNLYYAFRDCDKDDRYTFSSGGQLTISRGAQHCDAGESNSETGAYSIDTATQRITLNGAVYMLAEISAKQLKYYAPAPGPSGYNNVIYLFER